MFSFIADVVCIMMFILCTIFFPAPAVQTRWNQSWAKHQGRNPTRIVSTVFHRDQQELNAELLSWLFCWIYFLPKLIFLLCICPKGDNVSLAACQKQVYAATQVHFACCQRAHSLFALLARQKEAFIEACQKQRWSFAFAKAFCLIGVRCILPDASVCIHTNWK